MRCGAPKRLPVPADDFSQNLFKLAACRPLSIRDDEIEQLPMCSLLLPMEFAQYLLLRFADTLSPNAIEQGHVIGRVEEHEDGVREFRRDPQCHARENLDYDALATQRSVPEFERVSVVVAKCVVPGVQVATPDQISKDLFGHKVIIDVGNFVFPGQPSCQWYDGCEAERVTRSLQETALADTGGACEQNEHPTMLRDLEEQGGLF